MKKILFLVFLLFSFSAGIRILNAAAKPPVVTAPPVDKAAELRKKDSITYAGLVNNSNTNTFEETENEVVLSNGLKIKFIMMTRFPIPRGVPVIIPDSISLRYTYELAELQIQATNTTSSEIKIDPSEAVFVSVKLYSTDNDWKAYSSQYALSMGSIYLKTEPALPDKSKAIYDESSKFFNQSYKAGETKTSNGIIVAISKSAKHIDRIVVTTKEFGQNISYGCPAKL